MRHTGLQTCVPFLAKFLPRKHLRTAPGTAFQQSQVTATGSLGPSRIGGFARDDELKATEMAKRMASLAFYRWRCESMTRSRALRHRVLRVFEPATQYRRKPSAQPMVQENWILRMRSLAEMACRSITG